MWNLNRIARHIGLPMMFIMAMAASPASAQVPESQNNLVSTWAQYCVATLADPAKLKPSADWQAVRDISDEAISALGGPFSSYRAWNVPQPSGRKPVLLVSGIDENQWVGRVICSVNGIEEGDVISDIRKLMGGARPFIREEKMWAAFGWEDGGLIREPTPSELRDPSTIQHRVAVSLMRTGNEASISLARATYVKAP
jgi:hypothetical protein